MSQSGLGYTLFGDKPMTHIGYWKPGSRRPNISCSASYIADVFDKNNIEQIQGWEIWKKYESRFPITNYIFLHTKNFIDNELETILVINKAAFLHAVRSHLSDFKVILGKDLTPESLLEKIVKSDDVFGKTLKNHQGLIGVLLGYGRDNSYLFHEENGAGLKQCHLTLDKMDTVATETVEKHSKLRAFDDNQILQLNPLFMALPCFAANPHSKETKQLKEKYMQQFKHIVHIYRQGDFLETTFNQLLQQGADSCDTSLGSGL